MDADIKALANEVAKINPPPHPSHSNSYTSTRGPSSKQSIGYHPYNRRIGEPATQMTLNTFQAARLQAQAAAINAARTRTLISAATQAQTVVNSNRSSVISCGPKTNVSKPKRKENEIINSNSNNSNNNNTVGPSYVKNTMNSSYNKYKLSNYRGTNYKRYDYDYKKTNTTIPNSSLRNHLHCSSVSGVNMNGTGNGKIKKKKLKATHQYQLRTAANEKWVDPTMTDWPENDFRIFCGDLGNEVSDAMLTSAFSKYSSFAKAKVVRDKRTGKSKGYGFVSFLEPHDFIRAFKEMNGKYVGNRPIKLRKSKWKERMKKVKNFKIRQ